MWKPAAAHTWQPGVTNTNLAWTGLRRNDFTLRIVIRNGSAGRGSARISARRLQRSFRFAAHWCAWLDLSGSCGARGLTCATWVLGAGWGWAIRTQSLPPERRTRGWGEKRGAKLGCTPLLRPGVSV